MKPRLLLIHKQKTSARTRFLRFPPGLLAFEALPEGTALHVSEDDGAEVLPLPTPILREAEQRFGLPPGSLEPITDFRAEADTPSGVVPVLLAGFTTIDPPFAAAEALGGKFIAITEARGVPPLDLELARRAYEVLIG